MDNTKKVYLLQIIKRLKILTQFKALLCDEILNLIMSFIAKWALLKTVDQILRHLSNSAIENKFQMLSSFSLFRFLRLCSLQRLFM